MADLVVGIDLGTTNCCAAIYRNGKVEILENNEGERTTPSYVFFTDNQGENCTVVGKFAKAMAETKPENGIYEIKRLIGRRYSGACLQRNFRYLPYRVVAVSNKPVVIMENRNVIIKRTPEELYTCILGKIKKDIEDRLRGKVENAVVTVPAYFGVEQKEATLEACQKAGFKVLKLLNEPTAAALAYYDASNTDKGYFSLVYDMGGDKLDVAVLKSSANRLEILAVDGDAHLGGQDFDNLVFEHVCSFVQEHYGIWDLKKDRRALQRLYNKCERAKQCLSVVDTITIDLAGLLKSHEAAEVPLTRPQFEDMIIALCRKTIPIVDRCVRSSSLHKTDIDEIILAGGSTRIPLIQNLVTNYFDGKALTRLLNPDECVAKGAAFQAALLSSHPDQDTKSVSIIDVTRLSISIRSAGDISDFVIARNSPIPISVTRKYVTVYNRQDRIALDLYEGERKQASKNHLLGTLLVDKLTLAPPGKVGIDIEVRIDQNGLLAVSATDSSGKSRDLKIAYSRSTRSEREVLGSLDDAERRKDEDERFLQFAHRKNSMIRSCVDAIAFSESENDESNDDVKQIWEAILMRVHRVDVHTDPLTMRLLEDEIARLDMGPEVKRLIGRMYDDGTLQKNLDHIPYKVVALSNKPVVIVENKNQINKRTPEELCSCILKKIKNDVEDKLGFKIENAVVTIPTHFGIEQREATLEACRKAGLKVLKLLNEATAAALTYYFENKTGESSYSMVYDLGGGTFDVAILKTSADRIETLAVDGESYLGGHDFDNLILNYVCSFVRKYYSIWDLKNHRRALRRLRSKCEFAKQALSVAESTTINLVGLRESHELIEVPLTRAQFEDMIIDLCRKTVTIVDRCLKSCSIAKENINEVILVGGSTRIPLIRNLVSTYFDEKTSIKVINPEESIAKGAALQAAMLSSSPGQEITEIKISDVTRLPIGMRAYVDLFDVIFERNTPIPASVTKKYMTTYKYQYVTINIYEGERAQATRNHFLGQLVLWEFSPVHVGEHFHITFSIDHNGILAVTAHEVSTGKSKSAKIHYRQCRRGEEEVDYALVNAELRREDEHFKKFDIRIKEMLRNCQYIRNKLRNLEQHNEDLTMIKNIERTVFGLQVGDFLTEKMATLEAQIASLL